MKRVVVYLDELDYQWISILIRAKIIDSYSAFIRRAVKKALKEILDNEQYKREIDRVIEEIVSNVEKSMKLKRVK